MIRCHRLLPLLLLFLQQHVLARASSEMNERIASSRALKEVALSPDGRAVVSVITDSTAAGGRTHLWILAKASAPKQITGTSVDRSVDDSNPAWAPDGRKILYLEKADGNTSLKRIDVSSKYIETLSLSRRGRDLLATWGPGPAGEPVVVKGFALAPSGAMAIWAADRPDTVTKEARKDDQHVFGQTEKVRFYLIDDQQVLEVRLPDDIRSVTWAANGQSLLAVTEPASDDLGELNRLWIVERTTVPREIRATAENVQTAAWLPDGRILYVARCSRNAPIVCHDLYVQALDGSAPHNLTDGINGSLINGIDNFTTLGPVVTSSGDALVTIARRFGQQVARIRISDGRIRWIDSLPAVVRSVATNASQTGFALLTADRGEIGSVHITDGLFRSPTRLACPDLQPLDWTPLQGRRLEWTSDKQTIEALLYLPTSTNASERFPLVVDVHGGPAGRFDDSDYPLVRLLLEEGWAVLHVNPRGSLGYGTDFLASIQDDLGGADYRDVMTGVDAALAQTPLDGEKMAMIGFSYGATIASFALGRTDRFKALVAAAPVADQISEYGTESSSWYDRWYFGKPWTRLDAAWRQSPLAGVARAKTPLLLLQGESDPVNPPGQSFELYRALRQQGSPVELILFPRETHRELGQNYFGFPSVEPHHGIALRQRILDFLRDAFSGQPHAGLKIDERPQR
jgi:dipeptidyl aminopeptidase/acylaminoacyl peptidase